MIVAFVLIALVVSHLFIAFFSGHLKLLAVEFKNQGVNVDQSLMLWLTRNS